MKKMDELGVQVPTSCTRMVHNLKKVTMEQRELALKKTQYNVFNFPADLLLVDYLSDSGTSCMTDMQWASMILGDESYARNRGYYLLLDAIRDTFERGDQPKKLINLTRSGEMDVARLMDEVYLTSEQGGFVNGGEYQLMRPNAFITPQGRCAEYLLYSTLAQVLRETSNKEHYWIPSNAHFDTTQAHISSNGIAAVNLFKDGVLDPVEGEFDESTNPFNGNMDCEKLEHFIQEKGVENIPLITLTVTNNTVCGQPVSLANMKQVSQIAKKYGIPLFYDACRFAENAYFIKCYEAGYENLSIQSIVQEMFSYADGFTMSFKKDGLANIGGGLFFRDQGAFHQRYSVSEDIGIRFKEKQILTFGNDSYGALSGRDIMSVASGLFEVVNEQYLQSRIGQVQYFARRLYENGIPVVLPAGGHAVYIDMNRFFPEKSDDLSDFRGVGFEIELIRRYGIRINELGPYAFEWDQKTEEQRKGILNVVRIAVPRNMYGKEHIDYSVAAITELHRNPRCIPKVRITRGVTLRLRHFQAGVEPVYDETE